MDKRFPNNPITPIVSQCRTLRNSDLVGTPLDGVWDNPPPLIPWAEKQPKVFWRGSATGVYHKQGVPWRRSQRERLHAFGNNHTNKQEPILIDRSATGGGVTQELFSVKAMGEKWFDIGLAGGPVQCSEDDGSCAELKDAYDFRPFMTKEASVKDKFVVDVDGNAWSSRFRRLLSSNNVVLKASMYPEWLSHLLVPWYHYVPIRADYSDI